MEVPKIQIKKQQHKGLWYQSNDSRHCRRTVSVII